MTSKSITTVFGGSGFIGRHLVQSLVEQGSIVRVAVRDPEHARYLMTMGDVGQIVPFAADVKKEETVVNAVKGAHNVVNLVGVLSEWGSQVFQSIHVEGARIVASAAAEADVKNLIHISAIGADEKSASRYSQTKIAGEIAVKKAFPSATIIRPSLIFGPEDKFFNFFAGLARFSFVLPVFGCSGIPKLEYFRNQKILSVSMFGTGGTKFQPVYVGDVRDAIIAAINLDSARGQTFELGGPTVYSSLEIMRLILKNISRRRILLPIPSWYLYIVGWFLQKTPNPLLTCDQVLQLKVDNVVKKGAKTLEDLGIKATPAEAIIPGYLERFKRVGHDINSLVGHH